MAEGINYAESRDIYDAPMLAPCRQCGGAADYVRVKVEPPMYTGIKVVCSACGMQTAPHPWAASAGEAWNRNASAGARVITTQEILEFRDEHTDDQGFCACWLETIEGYIAAIVISVSASMDGREVRELVDYNACGEALRDWSREEVDAEGIRWRIWDKRPKQADRDREPWGKVAWRGGPSEKAREAAEALRRELAEEQAAEEKRRAEAARRKCAHCAKLGREEIEVTADDGQTLQRMALICQVDGHPVADIFAGSCESWADEREATGE